MYRKKYKRRVGRPRLVRRHRRRVGKGNKIPQYMLKPRLTTSRLVNVPFTHNFRQKFFGQTGSGRRRRHRRGGARIVGYGRKRHYRRRGRGVLSHLHNFVKSNKLASRLAGYAVKHLPHSLQGLAKGAHALAKHHGYGRRHRRHRRRGRGLNAQQSSFLNSFKGGRRHRRHRRHGRGVLSHLHNFVKSNKLASRLAGYAVKHLPHSLQGLAKGAHALAKHHGYGRRHRHHRRHRRRGRGMNLGVVSGGRRHRHKRGGFRHLGVVARGPPMSYMGGKRRRHKRHRRRGRGRRHRGGRNIGDFFNDIGSSLKKPSTWAGIASPLASAIPGAGWVAGPALGALSAGLAASGNGRRRGRGFYGKIANQAYSHNIHDGYGRRKPIAHGHSRIGRKKGCGNPFPNTNSDAPSRVTF